MRCFLSSTLGIYYIDMRPSIIHYTDNIYDGKFDENGVPMINDGFGNLYYSPVNICQYAFMIHADFIENKNEKDSQTLAACMRVLENTKAETETNRGAGYKIITIKGMTFNLHGWVQWIKDKPFHFMQDIIKSQKRNTFSINVKK